MLTVTITNDKNEEIIYEYIEEIDIFPDAFPNTNLFVCMMYKNTLANRKEYVNLYRKPKSIRVETAKE